jgi:hypothetical protein
VARKRNPLLKAMSAKHTGISKFTGSGYRRQIAEKIASAAINKQTNKINHLNV